MDEFELIKKYFHNPHNQSLAVKKHIVLGIGDDAAVFELATDEQLVTSLDTLVEDVHFPANVSAGDIARKALAVNLSDLAAMGATPHSFTLSLTLPAINEHWLADFSAGLFAVANQYELVLLGGDTCKGALSISIQINGTVKKNQFLTRSAAKAGDKIFVTGYLGLAALGLQQWQQHLPKSVEAQARFLTPQPRIAFAQHLYAQGVRCCIDISDGLLAELGHVAQASALSARIYPQSIPVYQELQHSDKQNSQQDILRMMLSGGDDYELCFAVAPENSDNILQLAEAHALPLACVGEFFADTQTRVVVEGAEHLVIDQSGYRHF